MDTNDARVGAGRGQLHQNLELVGVLSRLVGIVAVLVWIVDHQMLLHRAPADVPRQSLTIAVAAIGLTFGWSMGAFAKPLPGTGLKRVLGRAERWISILCVIGTVAALLRLFSNPG